MIDRTFISWPFFSTEHRILLEQVEQWCETHLSKIDHHNPDSAARNLVKELGQAELLRWVLPENQDVRSLCLVRETLARYNGLADFAFAMQGIGSGPIALFGNHEQVDHFLPEVAAGSKIAAFALSELEAGSDVAALKTSARREGDYFVLDGEKSWISNAGIADLYVVFARTGEASGAKGLSAFIVESSLPGFSVSRRTEVMSPHPLGSLKFEKCKVPATALLGEAGQGFKIAMATLDIYRSSVGAAALGFARRAFAETLAHVKERELFGGKLADLQLTQDKIAEMATAIDASALLIYRAAWCKDNGVERISREASMAKFFATENAQRVIDMCIQLLGARGLLRDSILEQLYRDIRPLRIYEGASEIQKMVIASQVLKGGL